MKTVAIIGLGLIGGSVALGLREQHVRVVGYDTDKDSIRRGLELGVIDAGFESIPEVIDSADVILLATPVLAIRGVLEQINSVGTSAVLTDVGSVKQPILDAFADVFDTVPSNFVPAHPIAGSERHGVEAATSDLFTNHRVLLTPAENTDQQALDQVSALWEMLGAEVSTMSVEHHDLVLAQTSHLPHLLAYSLIDTLSSQGDSLEIFQYAAGGLRDFSRIAASDPTMWRDIFMSNRTALLAILDQFSADLTELRRTIEDADGEDLFERLSRSKAARDHFAELLLQRSKPK